MNLKLVLKDLKEKYPNANFSVEPFVYTPDMLSLSNILSNPQREIFFGLFRTGKGTVCDLFYNAFKTTQDENDDQQLMIFNQFFISEGSNNIQDVSFIGHKITSDRPTFTSFQEGKSDIVIGLRIAQRDNLIQILRNGVSIPFEYRDLLNDNHRFNYKADSFDTITFITDIYEPRDHYMPHTFNLNIGDFILK